MENHYDAVLEWDAKICLASRENGIRLGTFLSQEVEFGAGVRMNYFS